MLAPPRSQVLVQLSDRYLNKTLCTAKTMAKAHRYAKGAYIYLLPLLLAIDFAIWVLSISRSLSSCPEGEPLPCRRFNTSYYYKEHFILSSISKQVDCGSERTTLLYIISLSKISSLTKRHSTRFSRLEACFPFTLLIPQKCSHAGIYESPK